MRPYTKTGVVGLALLLVIAALVLGWWTSRGEDSRSNRPISHPPPPAPPPSLPTSRHLEQEPAGGLRIDGQVIDQDSNPVAKAQVTLDSHPERQATTEEDGSFYFDGLLSRDYHLVAREKNQSAGPVSVRATPQDVKRDPVILRLRAGSRVEVRVSAKDNKLPVPGARLLILGDVEHQEGIANENGTFTFEGLGSGAYQISATSSGMATEWREVLIASAGWSIVEISLGVGAPISGRVVDQTGTPVANAAVALEDSRAPLTPRGIITADSDGRWEFASVAEGNYRFWSWPNRDGRNHVSAGSSPPITHGGRSPTTDVVIQLPAGRVVQGKVVREDGSAAQGARLRMSAGMGVAFGELDVRTSYADNQGAFSISGVPLVRLAIVADLDDSVSTPLAVDASDGSADPLRIVILPVEGIAGTVVSEKGEPVPEAQVVARPARPSGTDVVGGVAVKLGRATDVSDGAGNFRLKGLLPGAYSLRAVPPGGRPAQLWDQPGVQAHTGDRGIKLKVTQTGRLVGRVVAQGGIGVDSFGVGLGPRLPTQYENAGGAFVMENARPGTWTVVVSGSGFQRAIVPGIVILGGQTTDLGVVSVSPGRSISGRVVDERGAAVPAANIVVGPVIEGDPTSLASPTAYRSGTVTVQSDSQGDFSISGRGIAALVVIADHAELGRSTPVGIPSGSEDATLRLVVLPRARLRGATKRGGAPTSCLLQLTPRTSPHVTLSTSSGADGKYEVERLAPDEYFVSATAGADGAFDKITKLVSLSRGMDPIVDFDIPHGRGQLRLTIKDPATYLRLYLSPETLQGSTSEELDRALLQPGLVLIRSASAAAAAIFSAIPEGEYSLCAVILPGDPDEPATIAELYATGGSFRAVCRRLTLTASMEITFAQRSFLIR